MFASIDSRCAAVALLGVAPCAAAPADVIHVPGDHALIQAAIDAAADGDEVVVAPGDYRQHFNFRGKAITVRSADPMDDAVVLATVLHRMEAIRPIVGFLSGEGPNSVLSGFVLTGAQDVVDAGAVGIAFGSSPTVERCTFADNHVSGRGGAIIAYYSAAIIRDCAFVNNSARSGGAIFANEVQANGKSPQIINCTFDSNQAGFGGAVWSADARVLGCTFRGNRATEYGGAISMARLIDDCTFVANVADFGGGVWSGDPYLSQTTIVGCTFIGNRAETAYGAVRTFGGGVSRSSFINNKPESSFDDAGGNVFGLIPPPAPFGSADLTGDGRVDVDDLLVLLAHWGP